MINKTIKAQIVIPGKAQGEVLVSGEPLSFWGGYDQHTGEIIDRRHPLSGQFAAGKILALPFSKGSSTTTAILLEALHAGKAPAAILTIGTDSFFALATIVANELYNISIPIMALEIIDFKKIKNGQVLDIQEDGTIKIIYHEKN